MGFKHNSLHSSKEPHPLFYLKQRASFWVASLSLFTFLVGNMMGQHGWYGFWASVLGQEDLSAIAYVGTVAPLEHVVDYGCWADFGGDYKVHTFRQSPEDCRGPLAQYSSHERHSVYSMQYMSSYSETTEGSGTHSGIDVRVPTGTPVQAVMTGRVSKVGNQPKGFGRYVVLEHPNVPDPDDPNGGTITLFSEYAHLSAQYVEVGDIVHKGDSIALSGNTGQSSGPHLHFSLTKEDAPFYPFYPSNQSEGYTYTINPLLYVQSNFDSVATPTTVVARSQRRSRRADNPAEVVAPRRVTVSTSRSSAPRVIAVPDPTPEESHKTVIARLQSRRESRIRQRLAVRETRQAVALQTGLTRSASDPVIAPAPVVREVAAEKTVVTNRTGKVDSVEISHDGSFSARGWEKVRIRLVDSDGNTVINPELDRDLVLRSEFGNAKFHPSVISSLDFEQGEITVNMRPSGTRAVVIKVLPFNIMSSAMKYER
ncbi:MAG: M23 family metallopeptidase [Candidatus Peribacter sp.]|nr:M23 family metallopeptidase [Candidatus Peribacter sp.]MBT4392820.1 M23 family metallopeptidase [Candidatus Peribacter sp.]MBT4601451.1 M23 family metallopeptidase [Candidatus Peribacter sp.]MBT5637636.1 M23 family metallopeptidase [Candidatus Peribacter sp.]MBT6823018.1 M23 family metallopeptidase [Candidatus Peribacter sp.]